MNNINMNIETIINILNIKPPNISKNLFD